MFENTFPKRITLELTNKCNLRCRFCPRKYMEKERGDIDVGLAKDILVEAAQHAPVAIVPFFRGESFLHPYWDTLLSMAKELNVGPIQMATNASLLTEERGRRLLEIGVDFLSFSMDTLDPERYHFLRGADYDESLGNILRFLEMREDMSKDLRVQVSAVETRDNATEMDDFVEFWRSKVDRIRIYTEHSSNGAPGSLETPPVPRSERSACHKVTEDMVIYWNGDVALCNHDWTRRATGQFIANVKDIGVAAAWNSLEYQRIRHLHNNGNLSGIAPCEHCDHWSTSYIGAGFLGRVYE